MLKLLKKYFIPHEVNDYHPHAIRHKSILSYGIVFLLANYIIFPALGVQSNRVLAAQINPSDLIQMTNDERVSSGLNTLQANDLLAEAAYAKGVDMLKKQYWNHFGPGGETPWIFIKQFGYEYVYAGENLAKNFMTSSDTHHAWMNSKSHKDNIMSSNFTEVGVAVVRGEFQGVKTSNIVVAMYGQPANKNKVANTTSPLSNLATPNNNQTAPKINKPEDGSIVAQNPVTIKGNAAGTSLNVYENDKLIGELPNESAAFTFNAEFGQKENLIYIRSNTGGNESNPSNAVKITLDKVDERLGSTNLIYYKMGSEIFFQVSLDDTISKLEYVVNGIAKTPETRSGLLLFNINPSSVEENKIVLNFTFKDGKVLKKEVMLETITKDYSGSNNIVGSTSTNSPKSPFNDFFKNSTLANITTSDTFNILFLGLILLMFAVDGYMLFRKGMHRLLSSHSSFNIGIMLIVAIGLFAF